MRAPRMLIAGACAIGFTAFPAQAVADHAERPHTKNLHALGHNEQPGDFGAPEGERTVNSDLAFFNNHVFQGNYQGFRVLRTSPGNPQLISETECNGDQGDIVVWDDVLVRAWNSERPTRECDGETVPAGFEGVHVFNISNIRDPELVGSVELECGSHTVTGVPDLRNDRLLVYSNNSSSSGCADGTRANDDPVGDFMEIVEVPLDAPEEARRVHREPLAGPATNVRTGCHDAGVILGDANKAACASADAINVWDIGANATPGGSKDDPSLLFTIAEPGVGQAGTNGRWHSAAFTWDGEVLVAGWEPGGGSEAECEAGDPDVDKSLFFYDADTGRKLGQWVLPRPQGADENCTVHNLNVVPLRDGRYVAVSGNYQAGTWVTEFTDPANPRTVAWSDPASLGPGPFCGGKCQLGGAWSSYWYNGFIYESDITRGLNVFRLSGDETAGAMRLPHLNPQTQEFTIG